MKRSLLALCLTVTATASADARSFGGEDFHQHGNGPLLGPRSPYLEPIRPNAYGPGVNADATGLPFQWAPRSPTPWQPQGVPTGPDPTLQVKPNAYGLGVHADQYGRIVRPVCPFGQGC